VKELRHSNVFRGPGRGKNTAATAHGVLADGVVLDANYALQTNCLARAADAPPRRHPSVGCDGPQRQK
jgi:hypothetical protein